jgi:ribosome recycling factor
MMPSDVNSVAVVLGRNEPARPRTPLPIDFESFQLAPYLRDQSIDDIVEAIRASWELNPRNDPNALRLKFHPPTSILLASGPRDALNMAGKIISQLKISHPDAQKTADAKAAADRARLEAVADTAKKQFEERQKMTEGRTKGGPSPGAATEKK